MNAPIHISPKAIEEIKHIMNTKNIPEGYGVRVGVKGGGCGVNYVLGFDKQKEGDESHLIFDVPVFIQKRELMFLIGKIVDFHDGADERGFFFTDKSE